MTTEQLFTKLEVARETRGLNIVDFSKLIGISDQTYYNWKNGACPKLIKTFVSLVNFCKEEEIL